MYKLVEIFKSFQGEGRNTGRQVVFVRFAGCNLACPWCDTNHSPRFELKLEDLLDEIEQESGYSCPREQIKSIILTGGEPTIQPNMPELIAALKSRGYWIAVETNGTNSLDWLQFVDYIACSPKRFSPSTPLHGQPLTHANEVRIVADSPDIIDFAREIRSRITATDYYISPCDHDGQIDFATAKEVLSHLPDWSLSVQLHKILGFR